MPRHTLDDLLTATQTAIAAYTHGVDDARLHVAPIADVATHAARLGRTLARLEVLATMHPALTVGEGVPAGSVSDGEWEAWAAEARVLDDLVAVRPTPAAVRLRASLRTGDKVLDDLLETLNGSVLTVVPTFDGAVVELDALLAPMAPDAENDDDVLPAFIDSDDPAARELRRRFR